MTKQKNFQPETRVFKASEILIPDEKLRGKQDKTEKQKQESADLQYSLRHHGRNLVPVLVRIGKPGEIVIVDKKPVAAEGLPVLIDGVQRTEQAREISPDFPLTATTTDVSDAKEAMAQSIATNVIRLKQNPAEIAKVVRHWAENGDSLESIRARLGFRNEDMVLQYLSLKRLSEEEHAALARGEISLGNAVELARALGDRRIPSSFHDQLRAAAKGSTIQQFRDVVAGVRDEVKKQNAGLTDGSKKAPFEPKPVHNGTRCRECYDKIVAAKDGADLGEEWSSEQQAVYETMLYIYEMDAEAIAAKREKYETSN